MSNSRPKIGLALSGASGRAIAHIGIIEVLQEHNIPIDYIAACSSATIVAGSFSCGTMQELKADWLEMDRKFVWGLVGIDTSGSGILSVDKAAVWMRKYIGHRKFEDVYPRLGFVCADIVTGEPLVLSLGDMVKAGQASCAVPGLFKPVPWGNRILVDGGLFSIVPVREVREMGAELVIGVDIAATRQIIRKRYLRVWRGYNLLKQSPPGQMFGWLYSLLSNLYEKSLEVIFYNQSDFLEEEILQKNDPDLFDILGRAMSLVYEQQKKNIINAPVCDVMLVPKVKHLGKISFGNMREIYQEGRRVAKEAAPEIKKLIEDHNWRRKNGLVLKKRQKKLVEV